MNTRHMPGIDLGSFFIPGGNGFPDLEVLPTDPAHWVTMQIAAREATQVVTPEAPRDLIDTGALLGKITGATSLKDTLQGLVIAGGMVLLAILLIVLGAYQFTKD